MKHDLKQPQDNSSNWYSGILNYYKMKHNVTQHAAERIVGWKQRKQKLKIKI